MTSTLRTEIHDTRPSLRRALQSLLTLAGVLLLTGCGPAEQEVGSIRANPHSGIWQDSAESPFELTLEQTFGQEDGVEEALLGGIGHIVVDSEQNVYIFDYQASRLFSFAPDGAFRWATGEEGEAPGEFLGPRGMVFDGRSLIYVANQRGRRIDRYGLDGTLLDTKDTEPFDMGGFSPLVGAISPDTLVISRANRGEFSASVGILAVGSPWRVLDRFEIRDSLDVQPGAGYGGPVPMAMAGSKLVAGSLGQYRLQVFDAFGAVERVVTRTGIEMTQPYFSATGPVVATRFFSQVRLAASTGDYHIVRAHWPTKVDDPAAYMEAAASGNAPDPGNVITVDVYDRDWTLLYAHFGAGSEELGPIANIAAADSEGAVYARINGSTQVGRFRLGVKAP